MKVWGLMIELLLLVAGLCVYDGINNKQVFDHMVSESTAIYDDIYQNEDISNATLTKAKKLNSYWW